MAEVAPYGSWRSPIEPDVIAKGGRRLGFPALAADGAVWWLEGRAAEGGRSALMRRPAGGEPEEVTPPGANVRTRVHEYGGGAWKLLGPELVVYVDFADQRALPAGARRRAGRDHARAGGTGRDAATPTSSSAPTARRSSACASCTAATPNRATRS